MTKEVLTDIPIQDLKCLKKIFEKNWPYSVQAYMFLDHWIKWLDKKPNVGIKFTCPNRDWSDGTFVAIVTECTYNIFFYTLQKSCERLTHALKTTKRIDWKKGPYICAIHQDIDDECMKVLRNIGHPIDFEIPSTCYWLPQNKAINFQISYPEEFFSAPLDPNSARTINSIWLYKFPGSHIYLENLIRMNGGTGIFDKNTKELCSWIMTNDYGALGVLQTTEKYKRKKLASILIKDLAKRKAMEGLDSISNIAQENIASQKVFSSLGFVRINTVRWVQFRRNKIKNHL